MSALPDNKRFFLFSIVGFLYLTMLFACVNDMNQVNLLTSNIRQPSESAKDVEIIFSENAQIKMILKSPQMDRYEDANPVLELPKGVEVYFYDSLKRVTSSLTANYAIQYEKENRMEARRDVVYVNEKNEKLNTELLIWDLTAKKIYTKSFVKITTGDEILLGDDFVADEKFNQWVINRPRGVISIKNE